MIEDNEPTVSDELIHLDAYAPSGLARNNVKNTSSFSQRFFPLCFAIGLHGFFLWWLFSEVDRAKKLLPDEVITVLEFFEPEKKAAPIEIMPDVLIEKQLAVKPAAADAKADPVAEKKKPNAKIISVELTLYDDTGRIRLPVDFIEKMDEANDPHKRFDFQNPDLELAGTFLKRPPAIDFNPTQFEDAWKPDQDILTELLEKAVEKTMKEIKIPVPGNPGLKLVCQVSVLALGGGCGFVPNGGYGRVISDDEDDPNTLSPDEDKECQAWWEKINSTTSQREWLKTKELYELSCKKPLEKEKIKAK